MRCESIEIDEGLMAAMTPGGDAMARKHVPPSRLRYEAENPCISCRVTLAEKEKLRQMCQATGLSLNRIIRRMLDLEVANPLLKKAGELHDAFQKAWADLQKITEETERGLTSVEVLLKTNRAIKGLMEIKAQGDAAAMDMARVDHYIRAGETIVARVKREELDILK